MKGILVGGLAAALCMGVVACGTADESGGGGSGGTDQIKAHWLYTGPEDDGGYNVSMERSQAAMGEVDGVTTTATFEVPYSQRATQIAKQAVAQGSNMLVDTLGLSTLFTDVCKENPDVTCFPITDIQPQVSNSLAFAAEDWDLNYIAGVAAGLMTKTGQLGFNGSFDVPLIRSAVNSYALGCQSVRPDCEVRVIYNNTYFDPSKETEAAHTLINAGADVLRNWVDSPSFCQVAADEGVYAVGEFNDFAESCPDSIITSTLWDFQDFFKEQSEKIKDGSFKGGRLEIVKSGDADGVPHMTGYGDFVPDDVRGKIDDAWSQIVDGKDVITGPITDQDGTVRIKAGEVPTDKFLVGQWTWYVQGVIGG